jgi:SAM-dependent methyltransferase
MTLDFGYPWWISYGHLPLFGAAAALLVLGHVRAWPKWFTLPLLLFTLWSGAAFLVARFVLNVNGQAAMPTRAFLVSGKGRVLDIGAGTGRSSIMVLEARPQATLVALDLFAASFDEHFGHSETPQARLLANLQAAGVADRATIATGDMRKLPFEPAQFDGIVSAYAMDHLNRDGSTQSLAEAARVAKPGADFLLMVVDKEPWGKFAFGPLLTHAGMRGGAWWTAHVQDAGFQVIESGSQPGTFYVLARRR